MPEFEESNSQPNPNHSYTPRTDASQKPRSRRRSGGFKTEVASSASAAIGEVDASSALNSEKLSGHTSPQDSDKCCKTERSSATAELETPGQPAADAEPAKIGQQQEAADDAAHAHRAPLPERRTNPQPSTATLAAIKIVETRIAERRSKRDARRKERDQDHSGKCKPQREARGQQLPSNNRRHSSARKNGLLATINRFFAKLFNSEPKPVEQHRPKRSSAKRQSAHHGSKRVRAGQTRATTGKRSEQTRRVGNRNRSSHRQHVGKRHSAQSR